MAGALALTVEVGVLVLVGAGVGRWLDTHFGTDPALLLTLALLGLVAGFFRLNAGLRRMNAGSDDQPPPDTDS